MTTTATETTPDALPPVRSEPMLELLAAKKTEYEGVREWAFSQRNYDLCRICDGKLDLIWELQQQIPQSSNVKVRVLE